MLKKIILVIVLAFFFGVTFVFVRNANIKKTHDVNDFHTGNYVEYNGGEEAKSIIQEFIDSKSGPEFIKAMAAQQGSKNKNKWFWGVTTSAKKLNEELVVWYVETITAFYDFFEQ